MALWDLRAPFFQACNGTWRIFVHSTLHFTSLVRPRFSFPSFWVLLHIWENYFVVTAWEQANLSLILNLYWTRLKSGKILREFSNIACSKNLELHLLTNDYYFWLVNLKKKLLVITLIDPGILISIVLNDSFFQACHPLPIHPLW